MQPNFPAFDLDVWSLAVVAARTCLVYIAVLGLLRLFGKRELGQMAPFDLVVILLIANAVQNAMVGSDDTVVGGIVAALTLLSMNWLINRIVLRSAILQHVVVGQPVLLISNGKFLDDQLEREGLTRDQVLGAMREHGVARLDEVEMGWLEVDGTISFIHTSVEVQHTRHRLRGRKPRE